MAGIKVVDPNNSNDYIVINRDDFKAGEPFPDLGITAMELWNENRAASPVPARSDGEAPAEVPKAARLGELRTMLVADLGPAVSEEEDVELLVRLLDLETRTTAKALIQDRLDELRDPQG